MATKKKIKALSFLKLLKFEKAKYPFFLDFMLSELRYGHFLILSPGHGHNFNIMAISRKSGHEKLK